MFNSGLFSGSGKGRCPLSLPGRTGIATKSRIGQEKACLSAKGGTIVTIFGKILRPLFGVSQGEATAFGEGGEADSKAAFRLETVVGMVTKGCHMTLQTSKFETLVSRLNEVEPELRGYAYEGAGTGLAALDCLLPWKNRTKAFIDGPGSLYIYALHIGAGLALARLRRRPEKFLARLDPVVGWIAIDGYGFHEGFFSRRRYVKEQVVPKHLSRYGRCVFDHGIGRSIWFVAGANVEQVAATVATFAKDRRADLWSGVGLGCGYTGGVDRSALQALVQVVGSYRPQLATGVAIGAHARKLAGSPAPYTKLACEVVCDISYDAAAHLVELAYQDLPTDDVKPAYEIWRQRIETQVTAHLKSGISSEVNFVQ
jgi:enediyne biosynthesis protein E3